MNIGLPLVDDDLQVRNIESGVFLFFFASMADRLDGSVLAKCLGLLSTTLVTCSKTLRSPATSLTPSQGVKLDAVYSIQLVVFWFIHCAPFNL